MDLLRKFAGGRKDKGLDLLLLGIDFGEQGEAEGGSFAGSSLSLRYEIVPALEKVGHGLGLHRSRFPDAQFIEAFDEVGGYAQGFKIAHKTKV